MKFLKRNKFTILAIIIFLVFVVLAVEAKKFLVPDEGKAVYGNRLDEIKEHKISDEVYLNIENKLKEDSRVLNVERYVHGKIINYIITLNNEVSVNDAKSIGNSIIPGFSNNELTYYSLQVYLKKEDSNLNNFPIIGYKGVKTGELIYTKERDITKSESES